jgi:hypothetical protein
MLSHRVNCEPGWEALGLKWKARLELCLSATDDPSASLHVISFLFTKLRSNFGVKAMAIMKKTTWLKNCAFEQSSYT